MRHAAATANHRTDCAALTWAWAWWGTIDIIASATGKMVPGGCI
jgi:hypothetical protein